MLEGGDPNAKLGVIKVLGVNAALQPTLFIVSRVHRGIDRKCGIIKK